MGDNVFDFKGKRIQKAQSDKLYEYCTVCWAKTDIRKNTPVELRRCYVNGVGQLCPTCYLELYGKDSP